MAETRIPTQKRSLEKRNKIVEKGFQLMCEQGYFNTTTNDIAKECNISVGIIYQYFNDKKDIFIEGVKKYAKDIMYPMLGVIDNKKVEIHDLENIIYEMVHRFIQSHKISKKAHEELLAMSHLDEDISQIFKDSELEMSNNIITILHDNNIYIQNIKEKIHIIIGMVDNLCHEIVYHNHQEMNYDIMLKEVVKTIIYMFHE